MKSHGFISKYLSLSFVSILMLAANGLAQRQTIEAERAFIESSSNRFWFAIIFLIVAVLVGGFIIWRKLARPSQSSQFSFEERMRPTDRSQNDGEMDVDLMEELEWFRKTKGATLRVRDKSPKNKKANGNTGSGIKTPAMTLGSGEFQERMKRLQFAGLPIHSFKKLTAARPFDPLPLSSDASLLSAIEQASDEFEEDENVRELAVKILAAFKYRNSVESLSQLALYDLSSNLRSKCVSILTEFDHESVFETILLACADPTREVRAAAARGLFRLNFDRAEAWKRLIDTGDVFRMRQAARAAIESGIAVKSFDRLLHDDLRIAYEAFCLVALLIRSGETSPIVDAIRGSSNDRSKLALMHVIAVVPSAELHDELRSIRNETVLSDEVTAKLDELIAAPVAAIA